ncbi:MAG: DUF977 family protein [Anaplasmataceae bacterium]|nr:DUF977 family protein [Anaplasmataceae bacterium]
MVIIKLENVKLYYDKGKPNEYYALRDISLEIQSGEYTAFFGASGSGKSSMLYVIAGMEKPQEGRIYVAGKDITNLSEKEIAIYRQITVGLVFQQFNLIPSISVLDNIALPMSFLGIPVDKRREKASELLRRFGIDNLSGRFPYELSGGQQQRVGIARALANDPPIVIADEPLGNLDSENANKVLTFLRDLKHKDGRTIIMVTHEAWSLKDAELIYYIRDGEIVKTEHRKSTEPFVPPSTPHEEDVLAKSFANIFANIDKVNKQRHETKEIRKDKILVLLQENKQITNNLVESTLGVSDATATRYLQELEKEGKVRQEGREGRSVFYTLHI